MPSQGPIRDAQRSGADVRGMQEGDLRPVALRDFQVCVCVGDSLITFMHACTLSPLSVPPASHLPILHDVHVAHLTPLPPLSPACHARSEEVRGS